MVLSWAIGVAMLGTMLAGCNRNASDPAKTPAKATAATPKSVHAVTVQLRPWPGTVRVQGSLVGDELAVIGSKVAGRVKLVKVDLGSTIEAGDVIAQLDTEEFDLRVAQARAQVEQQRAKVGLKPEQPDEAVNRESAPSVLQERALLNEARDNYARTEALYRQNTVTTAEFQQREALLRVAEARYTAALNGVDEQVALLAVRRTELALALDQQAEAVVRAPFTGVVQERRVAPGTFVRIGEPVVTLVRTDPLRFRAGVPERQALSVQIGQPVHVMIDGVEFPLEAKVSRISPALDLSSRSLAVEVDMSNPGGKLRAGLFAEAEIVVAPNQRLLAIPAEAIMEFAGVEKVWLVENGRLKEQRIETGRRSGGWVEVLSGIAVSEQIAANARQARGGEAVSSEDAEVAGAGEHAHGQSE